MAVKIRLARRGRKKLALYDVVVSDARAPRDGKFIEKLGTYNPNTVPATVLVNDEKALQWILNGAQPTDTVRILLSERGILLKKHLQIGVNKGAITQEFAEAKFNTWKSDKDAKVLG
ncbi:MAG: 30S ribosomal protein S16, partial [Pseudarcicella sp.]|nr:30S ribosomal protein S16 [Pseudarcicella sp.]